ncbi:MAG TPA: hypothetical protein VFZ74_15035 [Burkholderiales bacterium]
MNDLLERLAALLPNLLAAVALLAVGWMAARLLRIVAERAARFADAAAARFAGGAPKRAERSAALLGAVVFWVVLALFAAAATQVLGLALFTEWLVRVLDHLPTLAAGLLIMVAGYVLAGFVADLVAATATRLAPAQRNALARLAQGATLVTALLVGADQMGVKVTWLAIFAAILVASLLGGVMISASLGARGYVANVIGAHYLRQAFHVGERVRVAGFEGRILEVTPTSLVLECAEGRVLLPGRVYHDEPIVLLPGQADG